MSIEKCSISATDITDEELTSFLVKLNLALQLKEGQPLQLLHYKPLKKFIKYNIAVKRLEIEKQNSGKKH